MREKAIIASCLADVGIAVGEEIVADLHAIGTREIIRLCRALLESGLFVLHGSSPTGRECCGALALVNAICGSAGSVGSGRVRGKLADEETCG